MRTELDDVDGVVLGVRGWPGPEVAVGSVPQDGIADLVALAHDARSTTIEAGHLVHATEPDRWTEVVEAFLRA